MQIRLSAILLLAVLVGGAATFGISCTKQTVSPVSEQDYDQLREETKKLYYALPENSDGWIILRRALGRSESMSKLDAYNLLKTAQKQARKANDFQIFAEAPVPQGWPRPSMPGLVRIKKYPAVRFAWVSKDESRAGLFRDLFKHIQQKNIKMTAPVVMVYQMKPSSKDYMKKPTKMAFLYRYEDQGELGKFGVVNVVDEKPATYLSVGMNGSYSKANFMKAMDLLNFYLRDAPNLKVTGPPRVLGYNSPFMPFWMKYFEVQLPIVQSK